MKKAVSKENSAKRDQYTVVLEDLRSHFRAFGENLSITRDRVERMDEAVARTEKEVMHLRLRVGNIEGSNQEIKEELALIRHSLITREELKYLESRVGRLEKQMRHA